MADSKNIAKGALVRKSMSLCKESIESGFYLEAIALTDSIVLECINRVAFYSSDKQAQLRGVNDGIRKLAEWNVVILDESLAQETLEWGKHRNAAIHGFIKLSAFDGVDWDSRRKVVELQAKVGYKLARRWLREATKHKI